MRGKGLFLPNTYSRNKNSCRRAGGGLGGIEMRKLFQEINEGEQVDFIPLPHGHSGTEYSPPQSAEIQKAGLFVFFNKRIKITTSIFTVPSDTFSDALRNCYVIKMPQLQRISVCD